MSRAIPMPALALLIGMGVTACSNASGSLAAYPWKLKDQAIPPFQILSTENPITDQYMVTYCVLATASSNSSRQDIQLISEKIIEGLPKHNAAIICFVNDISEKNKDWTIARTWWGTEPSNKDESFSEAGDYSKCKMKIAMQGESLPGALIQNY